eukprot:6535573-Prymnesium_polylepis.1
MITPPVHKTRAGVRTGARAPPSALMGALLSLLPTPLFTLYFGTVSPPPKPPDSSVSPHSSYTTPVPDPGTCLAHTVLDHTRRKLLSRSVDRLDAICAPTVIKP